MSSSLTNNTLTVGSTSNFYVNSSGFLGIGVSNPLYAIHTDSRSLLITDTNGNAISYQDPSNLIYYGTGTAYSYFQTYNGLRFYTTSVPNAPLPSYTPDIYCVNGIVTSTFMASDQRIKNNIFRQ